MQPRTAQNSLAVSTHIVLPNDTNFHNNLFGGMLMSWVDIIASVAARRHCNTQVVTASINSISFDKPIKLGETVTLEAKVSRAFNSSMEIYIDVWVQNLRTGIKHKSNEAISTFVALDDEGKTCKVPELIPETDEEKFRHEGALRRKQLSLILAKRMKPRDANELKALFLGED